MVLGGGESKGSPTTNPPAAWFLTKGPMLPDAAPRVVAMPFPDRWFAGGESLARLAMPLPRSGENVRTERGLKIWTAAFQTAALGGGNPVRVAEQPPFMIGLREDRSTSTPPSALEREPMGRREGTEDYLIIFCL